MRGGVKVWGGDGVQRDSDTGTITHKGTHSKMKALIFFRGFRLNFFTEAEEEKGGGEGEVEGEKGGGEGGKRKEGRKEKQETHASWPSRDAIWTLPWKIQTLSPTVNTECCFVNTYLKPSRPAH